MCNVYRVSTVMRHERKILTYSRRKSGTTIGWQVPTSKEKLRILYTVRNTPELYQQPEQKKHKLVKSGWWHWRLKLLKYVKYVCRSITAELEFLILQRGWAYYKMAKTELDCRSSVTMMSSKIPTGNSKLKLLCQQLSLLKRVCHEILYPCSGYKNWHEL